MPVHALNGKGTRALRSPGHRGACPAASGPPPMCPPGRNGSDALAAAGDIPEVGLELLVTDNATPDWMAGAGRNALEDARTATGCGAAELQLAEAAHRSRQVREISRVVLGTNPPASRDVSARLDRILTHRLWGPAILMAIFFLIFQAVYAWATWPMDLIDAGMAALMDGTRSAFRQMVDGPARRWPARRSGRGGHLRSADRPPLRRGGGTGGERLHDPGGLHERPLDARHRSRRPGHIPCSAVCLRRSRHPQCPHHPRQTRAAPDHPGDALRPPARLPVYLFLIGFVVPPALGPRLCSTRRGCSCSASMPWPARGPHRRGFSTAGCPRPRRPSSSGWPPIARFPPPHPRTGLVAGQGLPHRSRPVIVLVSLLLWALQRHPPVSKTSTGPMRSGWPPSLTPRKPIVHKLI